MRASDLRHALLLRAFELRAPDDLWPVRDRTRVTDLAVEALSRQPSGQATSNRAIPTLTFIARRARLATSDLLERDATAARAFRSLQWRGWITPMIVLLAFVLGAVSDALGASRQVNLLAPPLIGLIVWNLLMLFALGIGSLFGRKPAMPAFLGPFGSVLERFTYGADIAKVAGQYSAQAQRFAKEWLHAARPLFSNQIAKAMHLGAAALAAGALIAMYLRGLAFEYRAGWESTFLSADQVGAVLQALLTPASLISGIGLPGPEGFAELAFSAGPGENAAPWIHLWAITLGIFVIVPRLILAAIASFRVKRLTAELPFDFEEPYFEGLGRLLSGEAASLVVLPYGTNLTESAQACLTTSLQRLYGTATDVSLKSGTAYGDEDDFNATQQEREASRLVILFSLSATPERENHGQFILIAREQFERTTQLMVLIDESAFRARFTGNQDRLEQRQAAWRKMLRSLGHQAVFVQLEAEQIEANLDAMRDAHAVAATTVPNAAVAAIPDELESR